MAVLTSSWSCRQTASVADRDLCRSQNLATLLSTLASISSISVRTGSQSIISRKDRTAHCFDLDEVISSFNGCRRVAICDRCVALAQAFIEAGEPQKLYQYLHYHVLSDSQELADVLIRHGNEYPSLLQVGLDMYFRLGAINSLVHTLLEIGEASAATISSNCASLCWGGVWLMMCATLAYRLIALSRYHGGTSR